jgi:hypothetical protein
MQINYEHVKSTEFSPEYIVKKIDNNFIWFIPIDLNNSDYQDYLAYVSNGNKVPNSTLPSELVEPAPAEKPKK